VEDFRVVQENSEAWVRGCGRILRVSTASRAF
jgi:hypothetical protein